jgi:hypothetical protein
MSTVSVKKRVRSSGNSLGRVDRREYSGDPLGDSRPGSRRGKRSPVSVRELDPLLDDRAQFAVDFDLVWPVTAGADDRRALTNECTVLF